MISLIMSVLLMSDCPVYQELNQTIMAVRQQGHNINVAKRAAGKEYEGIVDQAYSLERKKTKYAQGQAAIDFGEKAYKACIEVSIKD